MAMLTFLRIGKEIHDETEQMITDHLVYREKGTASRLFLRIYKSVCAVCNSILALLGIGDIL